MDVVDRVEAAPGQERQIAAVSREHRVLVLEAAVGDVDDQRVPCAGCGDPGHLDLPQRPADPRVRPRQPRPVRREGEVPHRPVDRVDQLGHLAARILGPRGGSRIVGHGDEQQPSVVRGDGEALALRVGHQLQDAAQLAGGQPPGLAVAGGPREVGDLDRVLALRVRHIRDLAGRAEHLREPDPYPRGVGDRSGRAVAVGEPVQAAAYDNGARAARLVHRDAVHVLGCRDLVAAAARARPAQPYVHAARYGVGGEVVDDPQIAGALVHHPGAVARGVPGVERVMVGVAAQAGAVVGAGVEVADALVVGQEGDTAADEHGGVEVAFEVGQQPLAVQPQPARRPAPVALPGGGLVRQGAREEEGPALAVDLGDLDVGDRAPGQLAPGVAVGGHLVGPGEIGEGLAVGGDGEDGAARVPAADLGVGRAPVGELPAGSAVHRHHMDLGDQTPPARVRDRGAVRREAGWPIFVRSTVRRQARPGPSRGASQRSSSATKHKWSPLRCGRRR